MQVDQIAGLGIDGWLIGRLKSWGYNSLTEIQRRALTAGVADGQSMIVCAPTSSGKTLVGEIAVVAGLRRGRKGIYLVSHKALADQKFDDFRKRFGEDADEPLGSVGLSTGDRDEGEHDAQLLIATYEKALGLILSNQLDPKQAIVVADELQILGDRVRGPDIEALCAVLRQRKVEQLIALTATVENPDDLAGWMNCKLIKSHTRDVALHQEIYYSGKGHRVTFGQAEGQEIKEAPPLAVDTLDVVAWLVQADRSPVLVFTETRREASDLAKRYSQGRTRVADGIAIAEQLDLFSEPTEASEQLRENAERRVAFHTADLTPEERQVLEQGFINSKFEVCFATSTLAAGVNFPFKSVLFPKLTYQYGARAGNLIPLGEYRNMSGRAGRLGMHQEGFSILLPRTRVELKHANTLVLPENDSIASQLVSLSMRRSVLMLIASGLVDQRNSLQEFFENSLYWYQTRETNPRKLAAIVRAANDSVDWLLKSLLIEQHDETLLSTPLGKATSMSGLLPSTAASFVELLRKHGDKLEQRFEEFVPAILYWVCSSEEFFGNAPSRLLGYPRAKSYDSLAFLSTKSFFQPLDKTNTQLSQCVHALILYVDGMADRKIAFNTNVSSGVVHRLATDVSWVLDGLQRVASVPELRISQRLSNHIGMLARRVRWGAPAEALDIIRVAERHRVPGFGRQRAMALLENGLATLDGILHAGKETLFKILRNEQRTASLIAAIANAVGLGPNRYAKAQIRVAKQIGLEKTLNDCNTKVGTEYETAIIKLLEAESTWNVTRLDDGKRPNVPDILLTLDKVSVLIECKTCIKQPAFIKKEEAFAVLQKGNDFDPNIRRVSLGKPAFDEHSKMKAQASSDISLVEHSIFIEGMLRLLTGSINATEFLTWLGTPGVTEITRLGGKPTYAVD